MKILVTGAAGFIGAALSQKLLSLGNHVAGLDNLNNYYSVELKKARLANLQLNKDFSFLQGDLADGRAVNQFVETYQPEVVVNLAAQAGVRYSLENPQVYVDSNIKGFVNILEACRHMNVQHLVYASTSSVYGLNSRLPSSVHDGVDHPISLYAATKRANELMAHSYSHLFDLPTTGLRFFTVYGPWGRPDMALFQFTKDILAGVPIKVFNSGHHQRDFTFIDDIVEGVSRVALGKRPAKSGDWSPAKPDPAASSAPFRIYNIGNNKTVELLRYIEVLEQCLGKKAEKQMLPMQAGDMVATWANVDDLVRDFDYRPNTPVEVGVRKFVNWYREYYKV